MIDHGRTYDTPITRRTLFALTGFFASGAGIAIWPAVALGQHATPETSSNPGRLISIGDVELYLVEHGEPSAAPIMLLHGGMGNSENWDLVWPDLVEAGYRAILVDSRCQGRSGWSDDPITFERMAGDVIGLLDHLGIAQADIVGWSDGAIVGLTLALSQPERLRRVVAYGANYTPDGLQLPSSGPAFEAFVAQLAADYQRLSPQPERFEELFTELGALYAVAPNFTDDQLRAITTPFLILDGENEELVSPEQPLELAQLIPNATLVLLPGTGHFAPFERPEEFAKVVLAFLASESDGTPPA